MEDPESIEEYFEGKDAKVNFFNELIEKRFKENFERYDLTLPSKSEEKPDRYTHYDKVIDEDGIERLLKRPELLRDLLNLLFHPGKSVIGFTILEGEPYLVKDCPKKQPIDTCLLLVDNTWRRVKINNSRITYLD